MTCISKTSVFVSLFVMTLLAGPMPAQAEGTHGLDDRDARTVVDACERDQPFLPIIGDLGEHTGEYALPVRNESGEVIAAIVLSHAALRSIPECRQSQARLAAARTGGGVRLATLTS